MKTNGNDWANPVSSDLLEKESQGHFRNAGDTNPFGLTKREYFASLAMQGLISQTTPLPTTSLLEAPKNVANWAVIFADELIKSLNEQK